MVDVGFKKTKGNLPIYGGSFGRIRLTIYKNRNRLNVEYFTINFSKYQGSFWSKLPVTAGELANLQHALDYAKKWLRDIRGD